jgi:hypothetical protein
MIWVTLTASIRGRRRTHRSRRDALNSRPRHDGRLRPLAGESLYPVFVAARAAVLYAVTSLVGGSGFLAVFVAGLFLGDASIPYKHEIKRFQGSPGGAGGDRRLHRIGADH